MFAGKVISHYRVLKRIGRGGLGEVFLAEDTILGRRVALKFLTTEENALEQILAEARSAASIDHPYVCKVFETGVYEGKPFIAMEFLEGETLTQHLKSGPAPIQKALTIAIEISEALAEAHRKGIIHRDLKPSNVMITSSGHVKLMDFGLAQAIQPVEPGANDEARFKTEKGRIAGTLAYMAPEQARGENLDARADVFSLGIVFFEMLCGIHPFQRNTPATTIAAILHEEPPAIERYVPAAYSSITQVLKQALNKSPAERYASAVELASDLIAVRDSGNLPGGATATPGIAILPFKDLSPQHDQEYFCDGLAEELMVVLGRIEQLRVVSRNAAFCYRNADAGLKEIGRELNVTTIMEGSVRKSADHLRIVVNLVDVENGNPIWSERYDRQLVDIFEIQDDISRAIAEKLRVTLTFSDSTKLLTTGHHNVRAYESYLKGRYFWNRRTEEDLNLSIGQFERALAEDPEYALAFAGLADAHVTLTLYGAVRPIDALPLARNAADRALQLKPKLPEALTSCACIHAIFDWDWHLAAQEFDDAIRLNPRYAQARQWFAMNCLAPRSQFARAREQLKVASELEPVSLAIATSLGVLDFFEKNYDAAILRFRSVLEMEEGFYLAHYFLGQTYSEKKMHQEAIRELDRAVAVTGRSSESLAALGYAHAAAGNCEESLLTLQKLLLRNEKRYVSPVLLALVQTGLNQQDAAIANLQEALEIRAADLIWLNVRPAFEKIRSHDRVAEILVNVGLRDRPTAVTELLEDV